MTKTQMINLTKKIHFYLLGFGLLNFALKSIIEISLNYSLAYFITILIYISGFLMFFLSLRPFKKIAIYFSIYIITPIFTLLFWLFGGIFLAILASIVLYPIYPNEIKAENGKIVIHTKHQGFLGRCCTYNVTEKKYLLLEKKIAEINLEEVIGFENVSIKSINEKTELKIKYKKNIYGTERNIETDTIITIIKK
ncbi:hypothetical protein [Leeuwenhoekiella sp. MAR_2009_132]|uniref:hypothetical protein n=1 Tax=Leeuwenhoekiella sp. MAR_2009_132 TaxID=1392489 RepID=UPI000F675F02|nr:hypothetical protein [Leeuwenhoekiella sp. MAR_2009_132]